MKNQMIINGRKYETVETLSVGSALAQYIKSVRVVRGVRGALANLNERVNGSRFLQFASGRVEEVQEMTEYGEVLGYTISVEELLKHAN